MNRTHCSMLGSIFVASLVLASPAFAGPPLLCFPFDTGGVRTLPMGAGGWKVVDTKYDVSRLADDTIALLTPTTPVVARMETKGDFAYTCSFHPMNGTLTVR